MRGTFRQLLARLSAAGLVIFGGSLLTFVLARVIPGNPVFLIVGEFADDATIRATEDAIGLHRPYWQQYLLYVRDIASGNFGTSFTTSQPVAQDILLRFPATLELTFVAMLMAIVIAFSLGIGAAKAPRSLVAKVADMVSSVGAAMPTFWLGLILIYVFFYVLGVFPAPLGRYPDEALPPAITRFVILDAILAGDPMALMKALWSLALPALTLALHAQPPLLRLTQIQMEKALASDAVRTARALGLPGRTITYRYAMRLSLLPVLHMIVLMAGAMLSGSVLVETVFSWPGIGLYSVQAIHGSDYPAIQGVVLVSALTYVLLYLIVDLLEVVIDPRLRTT